MQAVSAVFLSKTQAEQAVRKLQSSRLQADRVSLLTSGGKGLKKLESVPVDTTEQPGMGTAIGAVVGGAAGLSGGLIAAVVPGVGPVTAVGLLGAEAIDAAREQWWIGLRSAEQEHYLTFGRDFRDDEKFYRLGFEAALHARSRCKEFDQVSAEMASDLEDLERQYPGIEVAEPFTRGYQRGREHYQHLCEESRVA